MSCRVGSGPRRIDGDFSGGDVAIAVRVTCSLCRIAADEADGQHVQRQEHLRDAGDALTKQSYPAWIVRLGVALH